MGEATMNGPGSFEHVSIDQKSAEMFMRMLMLAINNVTVYGGSHPSSQKSVQDFFVLANKILASVPLLTLMLERDAFFMDQWRVDQKLNAHKLATQFKKSGLQSITLERGVSRDHIRDFLKILIDTQTFPTVEDIKTEITNRALVGIKLNYVVYQKVTTDETVVNKSGTDASPARQAPDFRQQAVSEIGRILSMRELLEKPGQLAGSILNAAASDDIDQKNSVVDQLKALHHQVSDETTDPNDINKMMETLYSLKTDLLESIRVQKAMGKIIRSSDPVLDQVDVLTCDVVVKMVREEYKQGAISIKRLGVIIRRMIPDMKDLQRFLPRLKQALMADGMPVDQFVQLIQELYKEIQSDGLMEVLEQGADAVGLTAGDIIAGIKENPVEAARLIVLATEMRQGGAVDGGELSKILSDYVERTSSKQVLELPDIASQEGGKVLADMLKQIQAQLMEKLKGQGVQSPVLARVEEQLSERFQKSLQQLKSSWLFNCITAGREVTESYLTHLLEEVVEQETDLQALKDPLREALLAKGYAAPEIQRLYEQIAGRVMKRGAPSTMPKGILTGNNTLFFLKHQIGMCVRYSNPFSSVMITVPYVEENGIRRAVTPEESPALSAEVFAAGVRMLRDLDLFGSLGTIDNNRPFIILPMTPPSGARVVQERLRERLNRLMVMVKEGTLLRLFVVVSAHCFDKSITSDLKSYLEYIRKIHAREEQAMLSA
jgi:hypothetical protein